MARAIRHILFGMGQLFDLSGCFESSAMKQIKARRRNMPRNANEAFHSDLMKIGSDMKKAMSKYSEKHVK